MVSRESRSIIQCCIDLHIFPVHQIGTTTQDHGALVTTGILLRLVPMLGNIQHTMSVSWKNVCAKGKGFHYENDHLLTAASQLAGDRGAVPLNYTVQQASEAQIPKVDKSGPSEMDPLKPE